MEMAAVVMVYAGLLAMLVSGISVVKPIRVLGFRTRWRALGVGAAGLAMVALGLALPAPERRVEAQVTRLDDFMPVYQFHEFHSETVRAGAAQCDQAIHMVGPEEIAFFRALRRRDGWGSAVRIA